MLAGSELCLVSPILGTMINAFQCLQGAANQAVQGPIRHVCQRKELFAISLFEIVGECLQGAAIKLCKRQVCPLGSFDVLLCSLFGPHVHIITAAMAYASNSEVSEFYHVTFAGCGNQAVQGPDVPSG